MISSTPAFNLKAVLNETGLAADTLRAWERRYGLPMPQRTAGGHRLYSQRDVETIKWLMKRQVEGVSISHAVDMWNENIASGLDPLADSFKSPFISTQSVPNTTLEALGENWIKACMAFDEATAEQILNQAFSMFPVESVCMDIIQKGISKIGSLWYENQVSVQQQHFASSLAMRRIDALISASPAPTRNRTVLVGCPPEEWHTFPPLLLSLLLRRHGFKVIYLGANVPAARFSETVKDTKADLVILVAQHLISAATLQQTALALSGHNIPVAFGGRIFNLRPNLKEYISGYFLSHELNSAVDEIEKILKSKAEYQQSKSPSQVYIAAHKAYISRRSQIEATVKEMLEPYSISPENTMTGIHFLGENISAALQLGDMEHVSAEIDWLNILLQSHSTDSQQLTYFLEIYSQAVDKNINGKGKPIKEWLIAQTRP